MFLIGLLLSWEPSDDDFWPLEKGASKWHLVVQIVCCESTKDRLPNVFSLEERKTLENPLRQALGMDGLFYTGTFQ